MVHFSCDQCGKELRPGEDDRFIIKIEAIPAQDPSEITEADLDEDHMEAVSELLNELEDDLSALDDPRKSFRYDLCEDCHRRFVHDPLGKESSHKLFFSKN